MFSNTKLVIRKKFSRILYERNLSVNPIHNIPTFTKYWSSNPFHFSARWKQVYRIISVLNSLYSIGSLTASLGCNSTKKSESMCEYYLSKNSSDLGIFIKVQIYTAQQKFRLWITFIVSSYLWTKCIESSYLWAKCIKSLYLWTKGINSSYLWTKCIKSSYLWTKGIKSSYLWTKGIKSSYLWTKCI